jgi:hypothetical protein
MPGLMAEKIDVWKFAAKPSGKQIDRERETVHLGKQRHDEGRDAPKLRQSRSFFGLKKL